MSKRRDIVAKMARMMPKTGGGKARGPKSDGALLHVGGGRGVSLAEFKKSHPGAKVSKGFARRSRKAYAEKDPEPGYKEYRRY